MTRPRASGASVRDDAAFTEFVTARLSHLLKLGRVLAGDDQRGADLISWQEFGSSQGHVNDRVALADDAILLRGERETLLTETGAHQIDTGLSKDASVWDAARVGDTLYLAPGGDVLASTDGGRTWEPSMSVQR